MDKLIFEWIMAEFKKGVTPEQAFKMMEVMFALVFDESNIYIMDKNYILGETVSLMWKIALGIEVSNRDFKKIVKRLKTNLLINHKAFYFWSQHSSYNDNVFKTNDFPPFFLKETEIHFKKKTIKKLNELKKLKIFKLGCLKKIKKELVYYS